MLNTSQYNSVRHNESLESPFIRLSNPEQEKYSLTVHDKSGQLLAYLPMFYDGQSAESVNGTGKLTFSYPLLESVTGYLKFPNQISLCDLFGELIEKYHILQSETIQDKNGSYVCKVECESILCQLQNELISYDTTGATIAEILTEWFNVRQVNANPIRLGSIDAAIKNQVRAISLDMESILEGIKQLSETLDGKIFYVDPSTRKFHWKNRRETYKGKHVSFGFNLAGIRKRIDGSTIINRVYVYGEDDTDFKKTLQWAGEDNDYLDNASSISQYGIRPGKFILKSAKYPEQLVDFARQALRTYANPRTSYEIDTLDLFNDGTGLLDDFLRFRPGQEVRVQHEDFNISVRNLILEVKRNLDSPMDMQLVFAEYAPKLNTVFEDLSRRLRVEENSPSPTIENTIDALDEVIHDEVHKSHTQLVDAIQDAVSIGLDESGASSTILIETIIEKITEQLSEHSEETINEELIQEIVESLLSNELFGESLLGAFVRYHKAETFAELPNTDIESHDFGFVDGVDSDDGKIYKRNAANSAWEPFALKLQSAANATALGLLIDDGELGYTTESHQPLYWKADGTLICLSHLA